MLRLDFDQYHAYDSREGITIPVVLKSGAETVDLVASVDTGATFCLFQREHGELLGLDVEAGSHAPSRPSPAVWKPSVTR